ncbi:hypothetical protein [Deferrisoma camini]|uniref:hypothetical protein n=1 Tax=Deferrisoma camini TaxID=1035120 RepID=UPI00146ACE27|nr:hypothetical protein [Deferrisoma camini]
MEEILGTRNQIRVLRALFRRGESSGSEVAREAGLRPSAALFALRRLAETGVVRVRRAGRRVLYAIDGNHFLTPHLEALLAAEAGVAPHLVSLVRSLIGEDEETNLRGLCITPDGRVYVCHTRPDNLPADRVGQVIGSMFGLRFVGAVPDPRRVLEAHRFVPAPSSGPPASGRGGSDRISGESPTAA